MVASVSSCQTCNGSVCDQNCRFVFLYLGLKKEAHVLSVGEEVGVGGECIIVNLLNR